MPAKRMVHLTTASGSFHARVLVARLGSEGIVACLRGDSQGPYPLGGPVEVLVEEDVVAEAHGLLAADAEAADLARRVDDAIGVAHLDRSGRPWLVGLALAAIVVMLAVGFLAHLV